LGDGESSYREILTMNGTNGRFTTEFHGGKNTEGMEEED
jgi:hypothetical protein